MRKKFYIARRIYFLKIITIMKIKTNFENNDSRLHLCRCCRYSKESTKSMKAQKIFLAIKLYISHACSKLIFGNYITLNPRTCFKLISFKVRDEEKKKKLIF